MGAEEFLPERGGLPSLRKAAASCRGCGLYERGTQTVFGEGTRSARIMMIGEQPGDKEDLAGLPFVGPAGGVLAKGLERAGIDPRDVYLTNIVKHFKWAPKGKRRIHKKPNADEIMACRPWLDAELSVVRPELIVCLGATAAQALMGRSFRVTKERGKVHGFGDAQLTATMHPSSILRTPSEERAGAMDAFVEDLVGAARLLD